MTSLQPVPLAYNTHEAVTGTDGNLSPIIYMHGITGFKESWGEIPQVVANATKRMSYSLDARNHGDSEWSDHFDFKIIVEDLLHFMDTLGIKKAILVGHSMGGITSIMTALKKPDRVEGIVVEDMYVRLLPKDVLDTVRVYMSLCRQAIEKIPPELEEDAAKQFVMEFVARNVPPQLKPIANRKTPDDSFLALKRNADGRFICKTNLLGLEKALEDYEGLQSEPDGKFEGPALFIYGKVSPFLVGADEYHIRQFFPNAFFKGVEDGDHSIHTVFPLEFTDSLLEFISSSVN